MEELELLRKKLYLIQKDKIDQKLSERNSIEIILKMIDLKMVDIIFSLDGKEYITPKQLEFEIKDEILRSGGRVVITDLQPLLNVDSSYIQDAIVQIKKKEGRSLQIYQGELLTKYYLDSVVQEIQEQLLEVGKLHINDLSNRFSLGVDLLTDIIQSRVGKSLNAVFDSQEVLYTQAHIDRHYHKVMGLFSSVTQPCIILQLIRKQPIQYQFNERLVVQQLQQLIDSKRIQGIIQGKGNNAEYIPNIFSSQRSKWIETFYNQNQFITFDSLLKFQINDPVSYLKNNFKNGIALSSTFINNSIIDKIDDSITDIIENSSWLEILPLVPSPLTNKDISLLISNCPNMKITNSFEEKAIVLNDNYIISKTFIDRCFSLLKNTIQEKIENYKEFLEEEKEKSATTTTSSNKASKKPNNKVKSRGKQQPPPDFDSNASSSDEENVKSNKKHKDDEEYEIIGLKQQKKASNKKLDHLQEITQLLKKWYGNMDKELIESLTQYLRPLVNKTWETMEKEAKDRIDNEAMKERKQQHKQLLTQFNSLYSNFLLFKKGLDTFDKDALEKSTISALLLQLPLQLSKSLEKLIQSLNKSSILDFIDSLEKATAQSQFKLKPLDKKLEKQLLIDHKNELQEQLFNNDENDIYNQFQMIVNLLYIQVKGQYVFSPPRQINSLIQAISKDESFDDQEISNNLNLLYQLIIKSFKPNSNQIEKDELHQNILNLINHFKNYLKNNL
ncbi:hypothetical protein DICPUDRAFT_98651 [Dictyostelium purpureum]|uniref:E3 UFM1-protein ligase 1 homolog n=1 Tax=Dictyostelium purpureum TaxID=5786 RepID=F0ZSC5_DICPU|nr:uncharacterized protein DICPUDRAFT_98651 [Dictyostelium purpureum]EGC33165.1 hypothetical protein DICPUDRAFT_98651 [Dictyostelium purpureum]|eukprot:XP_003290321.1 hypothetical protein DICPUDRAFT_98651 [Dictyostelium purpureum]